ncbi:MAG: insulinase family protein, partial [Candidatus Paceibacterota bacterium]
MADFQKERMKNGMTLLFERRNLPITSVLIATRAGAIHETADNKGIAHFTEHMTFKASKKREADEISSAIEKVGGIMNAFTANEITAFWCKIPSKHFSTGVDIIS